MQRDISEHGEICDDGHHDLEQKMRAGVWREFIIDMEFRSTEKYPKKWNLITILNY